MEDNVKKPCERCGKRKDDVEFREDPYASEINDDHEKHWLCGECVTLSADEI
jgi:hypothetical protein